jgi:YHS domain-containing protein
MKGSEIDKRLFVDYQGKRIYVCCRSCVRILKADPAKYVALMEAEGITLDKTPDVKK